MSEAGRELDALVAEHVMGWRHDTLADTNQRPAPTIWFSPEGGSFRWNAPPYSTDITAAWQVVEKMAAQGWEYEIHTHYAVTARFGKGSFDHWGNTWDGPSVETFADTAPLAICRAALRAVGVDL